MGQNAIAGALAGAFVSLCLHPIDTIKTVIQAQTGQHHNLFPVLSSIISQRGEVCFCLSTLQLFYLEAVLSTKGYRY
jgi:hypothetical protein